MMRSLLRWPKPAIAPQEVRTPQPPSQTETPEPEKFSCQVLYRLRPSITLLTVYSGVHVATISHHTSPIPSTIRTGRTRRRYPREKALRSDRSFDRSDD